MGVRTLILAFYDSTLILAVGGKTLILAVGVITLFLVNVGDITLNLSVYEVGLYK
jgi:hypothetical protein